MTLSRDRLLEVLDYDQESGLFEWKISTSDRVKPGDLAGGPGTGGYTMIGIDGLRYRAHRLAWLYIYGLWPSRGLDHRNGIPDDNRISNLREATQTQNNANSKRSTRNTSGLKGVSLFRPTGRWQAQIRIYRQSIHLGFYSTREEAHRIYCDKARELFGEFAREE